MFQLYYFMIFQLLLYTTNMFFLNLFISIYTNEKNVNKYFSPINKIGKNIFLIVAIIGGIPPFSLFLIKLYLLIFLYPLNNFSVFSLIMFCVLNLVSMYLYFSFYKFASSSTSIIKYKRSKYRKDYNIYTLTLIFIVINIMSINIFIIFF